MRWTRPLLCAAGALALSACQSETNDQADSTATENGASEAGTESIADGLDENSQFFQAAKAVGLDATLSGPDPYTVLVPSDQAFGALPEGRLDELTQPANRAELTRILTYHILPGIVLAEDIGKAIDNSDGTAQLATMGGETLTATKDGDTIVLTDASGNKATVTGADTRRSNGVVHQIDGVLMPSGDGGSATAAGE